MFLLKKQVSRNINDLLLLTRPRPYLLIARNSFLWKKKLQESLKSTGTKELHLAQWLGSQYIIELGFGPWLCLLNPSRCFCHYMESLNGISTAGMPSPSLATQRICGVNISDVLFLPAPPTIMNAPVSRHHYHVFLSAKQTFKKYRIQQ